MNLAPQIGQVKSCLPESIEVELRNTRHALGPYASPRVDVDDCWSSRPCRKWYSDVYRMHLWGVEKAFSAGSDRFASSVGFTPWGFCREVFIEKNRFGRSVHERRAVGSEPKNLGTLVRLVSPPHRQSSSSRGLTPTRERRVYGSIRHDYGF